MNLTMPSKRSNVTLPIKMQAILTRRKKNWNIFTKKSFKVSSFVHGCDGVNGEKSTKYFLNLEKRNQQKVRKLN